MLANFFFFNFLPTTTCELHAAVDRSDGIFVLERIQDMVN